MAWPAVLGSADPDGGQPGGDLRALQVGRGQVGQPAADEDEQWIVGVGAHGLIDDGLRTGRAVGRAAIRESGVGARHGGDAARSSGQVDHLVGLGHRVRGRLVGRVEGVTRSQVRAHDGTDVDGRGQQQMSQLHQPVGVPGVVVVGDDAEPRSRARVDARRGCRAGRRRGAADRLDRSETRRGDRRCRDHAERCRPWCSHLLLLPCVVDGGSSGRDRTSTGPRPENEKRPEPNRICESISGLAPLAEGHNPSTRNCRSTAEGREGVQPVSTGYAAEPAFHLLQDTFQTPPAPLPDSMSRGVPTVMTGSP